MEPGSNDEEAAAYFDMIHHGPIDRAMDYVVSNLSQEAGRCREILDVFNTLYAPHMDADGQRLIAHALEYQDRALDIIREQLRYILIKRLQQQSNGEENR